MHYNIKTCFEQNWAENNVQVILAMIHYSSIIFIGFHKMDFCMIRPLIIGRRGSDVCPLLGVAGTVWLRTAVCSNSYCWRPTAFGMVTWHCLVTHLDRKLARLPVYSTPMEYERIVPRQQLLITLNQRIDSFGRFDAWLTCQAMREGQRQAIAGPILGKLKPS
jgi:hypothetical protein